MAEFVEKGRRAMGTAFYTYDAFQNNCQNWVAQMASANGLLSAEGSRWIKQDIDNLIKELPYYSKAGAKVITDVARDVGNLVEEVVAKKGGIIIGHQRRRGRGGF